MSTRAPEGVEELTLEEFERLPEEDSYRVELVRGRLVREPAPGAEHGWLAANLFREIDPFARERGLGRTFFDVGFILSDDPPTVRVPDLAFLVAARLAVEGVPSGFWRRAPDLAVEVVSPSNTVAEIQEKVVEYLDTGARLVWVVDPKSRSVTAYRSRSDIRLLRMGEALDGADVLPDFHMPLSDLFALD